eukprot:jgi/Psemu1/317751/estExt_fgenesh1_pm.C_260016
MEESVRLLSSSRVESKPLTIVVTGCSSGIGLEACKLLRRVSPNSRLFLVARSRKKALQATEEVAALLAEPEDTNENNHKSNNTKYQDPAEPELDGLEQSTKRIFPMVCDQSSFDSVREFCDNMKNELRSLSEIERQEIGIDVLCLNAAILLGEDAEAQFTEDNLELTIQTNHFSPFLIANELFDVMNSGARVVVTSSGLHAFQTFDSFKGAIDSETGKIQDGFQMITGSSFDYKKCYAVSKLCNVAFCIELNERLQQRNAKAICFSPGLIPSSGLFKHQRRWHDTCLKKLGMGVVDSQEWGGTLLAWMAISDEAYSEGGCYWRAPLGISRRGGKIPDDLYLESLTDEVMDCKNRETLWKVSSALTGTILDPAENVLHNS